MDKFLKGKEYKNIKHYVTFVQSQFNQNIFAISYFKIKSIRHRFLEKHNFVYCTSTTKKSCLDEMNMFLRFHLFYKASSPIRVCYTNLQIFLYLLSKEICLLPWHFYLCTTKVLSERMCQLACKSKPQKFQHCKF